MTPLRVLIVEDREADAKLLLAELQSAGFAPVWSRIETEPDYIAQLAASPELILADYNLPSFNAPRALEILREQKLDIPFIIVSGSIGEDLAVKAIQDGATDYLLKDRLGRLGQAVAQALAQKELRDANARSQRALRVAEERMQQIIHSTPAAIYALKIEGQAYSPTWVSPSVERLTGSPSADVSSESWWRDHVHPDDLPRAADMSALFATDASSVEYRFRHADGSYRWIVDQRRLIRDASGAPAEIVGSWLDVTERKRLEEQFRQVQKMEAVGRLAGGVAHDFNNLLTVIMGYSEMALESLHDQDPLRELLAEITRAGQRAAALTRQLLAFSRKQLLKPVAVDLNSLLRDLEKMLRRLIGEDIDFVVSPNEKLWLVKVDPGQFEQVIMNLVVNARDAMPAGGKLTIETANVELDDAYAAQRAEAHAGEHVRISVSDTGCGMDAATRARIFEPFFTTKGLESGTGLGLATVYGIVSQSGGHIGVYSEPGVGTTFKIYIPREQGAAAAQVLVDKSAASARGTETILFVEDETGVRTLAKSVLEKCGYHVLDAGDPYDALALVATYEKPIDLLVTDVIMPNMNGRQLAERLTRERPRLPVLFISGYADDAIVRHGIVDAGTAFLQKPFIPEVLAQKVRAVLDGSGRAAASPTKMEAQPDADEVPPRGVEPLFPD